MTRNSRERLDLVVSGTAATALHWPGGRGAIFCYVAGAIAAGVLQQNCDGNWVPVKDINGSAITFTAATGMFNFELPEGDLRMSGTLTGSSVMAVQTY